MVLAIFLPLFLTQLRILPTTRKYQVWLVLIAICTLVGAWQSNSVLYGLIGFSVMPIGSLTLLAAIWVGWAMTKLLDTETICTLLIISATISLLIAIVLNNIPTQATFGLRLTGFHEHSLAWAIYIGVAGILAFWRFLHTSHHTWRYGLLASIFLGAVGMSGGRMALVTTSLAFLAIMIFTRKQSWPLAKLTVSLVIALAIALPFLVTPRLRNTSYAITSTQYRLDLAIMGVRLIKEHPFGIGYGNIGRYSYSRDLPSDLLEPYHRNILIESSHNLWLDITIGFGLLGGLISILLTAHLLQHSLHAVKPTQKLFTIILIMVLLNFITTPASITTLVLLGILIGIVTNNSQSSASELVL